MSTPKSSTLLQNNSEEFKNDLQSQDDFPPLVHNVIHSEVGETTGVVKEIRCSDTSLQAVVTFSQSDHPIIEEYSNDSGSEDEEIKEVSTTALLHNNTIPSPIII